MELSNVSLQDLSYRARFDAVLTIDAMENVAQEDWPLVLSNLHRAMRDSAILYITVEDIAAAEIDAAFAALCERGAPAVHGEVVEGDVAGYHYDPGRDQVLRWFAAEGLHIVEEGFKQEDAGWAYHHFLLHG